MHFEQRGRGVYQVRTDSHIYRIEPYDLGTKIRYIATISLIGSGVLSSRLMTRVDDAKTWLRAAKVRIDAGLEIETNIKTHIVEFCDWDERTNAGAKMDARQERYLKRYGLVEVSRCEHKEMTGKNRVFVRRVVVEALA